MENANLNRLRMHIIQDQSIDAENMIRQFPEDGIVILKELELSKNPELRRTVVELAGITPNIENCRLLIRRLSDEEMEVKELAIYQLSACIHPELITEILDAMNQYSEPEVNGPLALLIGQIGGTNEINPLKVFRAKTIKNSELYDQINLAMARLGDSEARDKIVQSLNSDTAPDKRVKALNDCIYIGDLEMVVFFEPALSDYRDMVLLSIPENPPVESARVADIAVHTMVQLGAKLSFPMEQLTRLEHTQLEEAIKYISNMHLN